MTAGRGRRPPRREASKADRASAALVSVRGDGAAPVGTPCANCSAILQGRWCHRCGQPAEDFHRSAWRLILEGLEGVFHLDGRLWRTLGCLFRDPARLTRGYLEGHRTSQLPPFRLFLAALLILFLVGGIGGRGSIVHTSPSHHRTDRGSTPPRDGQAERQVTRGPAAPKERDQITLFDRPIGPGASQWLRPRLERVFQSPDRFELILRDLAERFAFLMLPLVTALLAVAFMFRRKYYLFDHAIFALHSLSAMGLIAALAFSLSVPTGGLSYLVLLVLPVHLFRHLRGVYRTGLFGTLWRTLFLFAGSLLGAGLIFLAMLFAGLYAMD